MFISEILVMLISAKNCNLTLGQQRTWLFLSPIAFESGNHDQYQSRDIQNADIFRLFLVKVPYVCWANHQISNNSTFNSLCTYKMQTGWRWCNQRTGCMNQILKYVIFLLLFNLGSEQILQQLQTLEITIQIRQP